jgi:hypothetical protein
MEMKPIRGDDVDTTVETTADPAAQAAELAELPVQPTEGRVDDQVATLPKPLGVRYSQPTRYRP